ncbi:DDE superfamily endonuclease domain-containing protein [Hirsutella rhossiliensis]|uniref:DDE superfamily endonuclease domain-containing protein n=1 Tax=Hirsutella rhossiliensis TaxID=111463 RepID=A0A9P8MJJ7_9HYPO|nr:DDE superfamily endonuclease domain-containing protein [Hirsutella rhossiliensis]KAH0957523.1 DDE superfamily endonuclease domain-containing protein [Hirsutella rhossiliensis]
MSQRRKYAMASLAAADQAARLVIESHDDLEEGRRRQTRGPPPKPVSIREAAHDEDDALVAYVLWLQKSGFPASKHQIEAAALKFIYRRDPYRQPPSNHWYSRWLKDHPELRVTYLKAVERSRKTFEASDVCHVENFFKRLSEIITTYSIGPSEVWNEDECGIRIGSLRDRVHVIVVRTTRHQRPEVSDPGNREFCTLIAAANATGDTIPPWLIFHTFPSESWAAVDAPADVRFARSDTGFSNAEITLDWVHQFNWYEVQGGEAEPRVIPESERIYCLLVIDGFTGHTSLDFIQYCIKFDILIAVFPPHSTHLLQPLDVGVFQPLKHTQQKALRRFVNTGELHFTRLDFLESFWETFTEGFAARYRWRLHKGIPSHLCAGTIW